jgi:FtsP/CotA-like multicopper oxidase with cupredoxin domain
MDGVGGITECPIAPGDQRVYTFKATQYGTSWYHSHYSVQYSDGAVGGIVIRGPSTSNYDIDLGFLPFMDWFHEPMWVGIILSAGAVTNGV